MLLIPTLEVKKLKGAPDAASSKPNPIGQIIICLPMQTPKTKGNEDLNPNLAPAAIRTILAGPGVPITLTAKKTKLANAILIIITLK
jgi:hypothetical protein